MTDVLMKRLNLVPETNTCKERTMYRDTGRRWSSTSHRERPGP